MARARIAAGLALLALVLLALPGGSSGDSSNPTWAGTWNTDFGEMTLDAGGSGTYEGYTTGTISGHVDGNVDEGTWQQGDKKGDFKFTLSGLSFTGEWHYDTGGCGSACGWSGTCTAGPCLENDDPPQTKCPSSASASASPGRVANQQDAVCGANEIAAVKPARDWGDTRTTPLLFPDAMALLPSPIIVGPLGVVIFKADLEERPNTPDDFSIDYLRTTLTKVAKGKRKAQCLSILTVLTQDALNKHLESYDPDLTFTVLVVAACLEMAQELD